MYQIIQELEADNSRLAKEAIIEREARAGNKQFFEGAHLALSPYITFGVKKVPTSTGGSGQGLPWEAFKELAHLLSTRQLTGNDARDAIELALSASTTDEWNGWYRRILIKDLRCGVSEKTVNKAVKGTDIPAIPVFECMLAHDGANHEKKIKGVRLLEPKLDGVRCITIVNYESRTVVQYTRNGKVLENFSHIADSLLANIDLISRSYVLDGEVVSSSFQTLMKQVHRKDDVKATDARLMLFDIVPLSEFQKGKSILGQRRRTNLLKTFKPVFDKCGSIDVIEQTEVDLDGYVGELQFKQFNKDAIEAGFEGILIKDPAAPYECKRSVSWLKMKPVLTVDLTIIAVEEGTGKNEGKLGALICEGTDQGKFIHVNVGSGLTDEQRDEIWNDRESVIGQVVEVKADCITQSQDAEDKDTYSLRFPRFERFRGFAVGDKL